MAGEKRVLIIDDAVFQSEVLREVFQNEFGSIIDVEIAKEFEDSEELILGKDFDLILIDYLLGPNLTAVGLKNSLIESTETKAKWFLLSALDVRALKTKHDSDGFDKFIHKSDYRVVTQEIKETLFSGE